MLAYEDKKRFLYKFKLIYASKCVILIKKIQKSPNAGGSALRPLVASGGWEFRHQTPIV